MKRLILITTCILIVNTSMQTSEKKRAQEFATADKSSSSSASGNASNSSSSSSAFANPTSPRLPRTSATADTSSSNSSHTSPAKQPVTNQSTFSSTNNITGLGDRIAVLGTAVAAEKVAIAVEKGSKNFSTGCDTFCKTLKEMPIKIACSIGIGTALYKIASSGWVGAAAVLYGSAYTLEPEKTWEITQKIGTKMHEKCPESIKKNCPACVIM